METSKGRPQDSGVRPGTRRVVVMVGPGGRMVGGMDSVIRTYRESALKERYDVRFVATSKGGSMARRYVTAVASLSHVALLCLGRPRPLFHIHVSQRGSFSRKGIVVRTAHALGCASVLHLHGSGFDTWAASQPEQRKRRISRVFNTADEVIVLSEEWKEKVANLTGRPDSIVLANPVTVPPLVPEKEGGRPVVAFMGRLGDRKGVPELLKAIEILQNDGVDADFVLAGDGEIERFQAVVATLPYPERVSLPGWLDRGQIAALLAGCTVFCLPSWAEGQPVAMLEAMAAARPCVLTPVGGIPSTITDGVNGLLVDPGDFTALAAALKRLLQDPQERKRLGEAARAWVEGTCSTDEIVRRLIAIYSDLGFLPA